MKISTQSVYINNFGYIFITAEDDAVISLQLSMSPMRETGKASDVTTAAVRELEEYFCAKRKNFTVPLHPFGTDFQKSVWSVLVDIPYGETRSYRQIAQSIGNPQACRAVGMANNRNPIPVFIPCHRVIGADGNLTGYRYGLEMKKKLLNLEGIHW